jgi:hypothetical protein
MRWHGCSEASTSSFPRFMIQTDEVIYVQATNGNNLYDYRFQHHSIYRISAIGYADFPISPRQSHRMGTVSRSLDIGIQKPRQVCNYILNIKPPASRADEHTSGLALSASFDFSHSGRQHLSINLLRQAGSVG